MANKSNVNSNVPLKTSNANPSVGLDTSAVNSSLVGEVPIVFPSVATTTLVMRQYELKECYDGKPINEFSSVTDESHGKA